MSNITVGLDLGHNMGWTAGPFKEGQIKSGAKNWKTSPLEGANFAAFDHWLESCIVYYKPATIYFEKVEFSYNTYAAQAFGGYKAILLARCYNSNVPIHGLDPTTLKKFATGRGNASKQQMHRMARANWPDRTIKTHDEADALYLWSLGREIHEGRYNLDALPRRRRRRNSRRISARQLADLPPGYSIQH